MLPIPKQTRTLQKEVKLLRSFMIGVTGKDPEGAYHSSYVKKISRALDDEPRYEFKDAKTFLEHVRRAR